ncbi:hypothetical protein HNO88_002979 [Novosphingobium chloroacetimidivorans]|uniref:Uncharacterized protein n=1 Tax=Novosphingobium chloroacetimidivorans TaxID=1428314 RepID=A0A7W7KBQ4_9SPHN|nr:hypothetical protein [Novosphingobium chloroacetimidivorans]MBB4859650.1 hypothetical protein [Novosphingobium chloroacetimidivorans]
MTATVSIHPQHALGAGRYLLDADGRLHPERFSGFIRAVVAVRVRCKPEPVIIRAQGSGQVAQILTAEKLSHPDRGRLRSGRKPARKTESIRAECAAEATVNEARLREAKRLSTARPLPVTPRPREIDRPLARRKVPPPAPALSDDDDVMVDFNAALAKVQSRRRGKARVISKPAEPKIDGKAVAAAFARKKRGAAPAKPAPTQRALSGEGCEFCGVPGRRGCDHYLPCEGG